ncbi:NAD(P)/FAD-dependent oxidoreductase [Nocardia brasiliensis]|uniref:FAD-dependent pyridine nucleotide-disulfide oxidoreductase n=1 Tax=Nocardia brasiliensis (strain ATCC 700358 / HUJEG-1) TaxID=1133849 RepID=K0ERX0_NOCB7|nr:NAD(P)/FAD-dependent oxidoreductase [Nocardia brasiliensis]AFT99763.1 FAD-dependent pyridine nucleotide-disulfide oxidoreductase [Nocardia brasiliensis ATCC 700358]OCF87489.1 thioredoxin reductase [Nocardia brasiliensis]
MNETYEVVVVGGGAAGLSAALVLTRSRRRVAVVRGGPARNAPAEHMHGFLSRDGMPPGELLTVGAAEVAGYGGELIDDVVTKAEKIEGSADFTVQLASGRVLTARRLLIATGLRDELPDLPGVQERWGAEVLHCPYCHGYEVRDQPLGLLGGADPRVLHLALLLPQWSDDVILFPHTMELSDADRGRLSAVGVRIVEGTVARLVIDGTLRAVELTDGRTVSRSALFVAPRFVPEADLLHGLGCAFDDKGWVVADPAGRTSVPGVWAAGNVANAAAQVVVAAGAGYTAAVDINGDLALAAAQMPVSTG